MVLKPQPGDADTISQPRMRPPRALPAYGLACGWEIQWMTHIAWNRNCINHNKLIG
jgi:hypothetical protein